MPDPIDSIHVLEINIPLCKVSIHQSDITILLKTQHLSTIPHATDGIH